MITYKDKTFCASFNCIGECGRRITEQEMKEAQEIGLPIAYGNFCSYEPKHTGKGREKMFVEVDNLYDRISEESR